MSDKKKEPVIAKVGKKKLTWSEARRYVPAFFSKEDSIQKTNRYIETWVTRQLIIDKAKEEAKIDFEAIDAKVDKLKDDLIIHEFNSKHVEQNLDTAISQEELKKYYNENKDNFILKEKIIKGYFIKLGNVSPLLDQMTKTFSKNDSTTVEELKKMSQSQATNYLFSEDTWITLNSILYSTPLIKSPQDVDYLLRNKQIIKQIENDFYFIRIEDLKNEQEIAPFETKEETITHIILNKRKNNLIDYLKDTTYSNAKKSEYKIY